MRIAFCSDVFVPEISGIADSLVTLGREMAYRGHKIIYAAPGYGGAGEVQSEELRRVLAFADVATLRSVPFPGSPTGRWRFRLPLGATRRCLAGFSPDLIHVHTPFGVGLDALHASRGLGVPLLGTNHTPVEEFVRYIPLVGASLAGVSQRYVSWFYGHCHMVTAPYPGLLNDMRDAGFCGRGEVVSNPVDLRRFRPASPERRARLREHHGLLGPVVFCAGRLAPEKNVDVVIRAIGRLRQRHPRLTLVLTGYGSAEPALRALVGALALGDHVRFVGHVSPERLIELYQAADLFAMLSTAETQCLALMNAYACGLPAVAAGSGALPYYVPTQCGFLVEPGDDEALAHSIDRLLRNADLRLRMGTAAFSFVQAFSVEAVADAWTDIYAAAAR